MTGRRVAGGRCTALKPPFLIIPCRAGVQVVLVSRGKWHWDSAARIKPRVRAVTCDRQYEPACAAETNNTAECDINALRQCPELKEILESTPHWDLVLDFSGYEPKWVADACAVLAGRAQLYIYISTDSVYEVNLLYKSVCTHTTVQVSAPKPVRRPSREEDAVRPRDPGEVERLRRADPYGHYKLAGEEAVARSGLAWVALRLADVVGPRDTTNRWWTYQAIHRYQPSQHVTDQII